MVSLLKTVREDIQTVFSKDPAARSVAEVIKFILKEQDHFDERLKRLESGRGFSLVYHSEMRQKRIKMEAKFNNGAGISYTVCNRS
ncbi:MAG: hypothetical protein SVW57_10195 [Thermodesulfobacteriota bacterium]|nr:hypothetical protein [Thermodesulfobacteriota bacterium]